MAIGRIFKIDRHSLYNGPGIRTTIFLKGCPLRCLWCANPESQKLHNEIMYNADICLNDCYECVETCPLKAIRKNNYQKIIIDRNICNNCGNCTLICPTKALFLTGLEISIEDAVNELLKDIVFYKTSGGGITISGGEPLKQKVFVLELLKNCKKNKIHTALDTCGYGEWNDLKKMLEYTDLVLYDLKIINAKKHKKYTGVSNKLILDNVKKISKIKFASLIIRLPLIPGINDSAEDIYELLNFLKDISFKRIDILPYHKLGISKYKMLGRKYQLIKTKIPEKNYINSIKLLVEEKGFEVKIV